MRTTFVRSMLISTVMVGTPVMLDGQSIPMPDSLPPGVTAEMVTLGKAVFEAEGRCAGCHGLDATGGYGPNLADEEWVHAKGNYSAIIEQIRSGVSEERSHSGTAMPPKGGADMSDDEVRAAAAYVWRTSHREAGDSLPLGVTPYMVEIGRNVFNRTARCVRCHGPAPTAELGADLTDEEWLHVKGSYVSILQRVLIGVPKAESSSGMRFSRTASAWSSCPSGPQPSVFHVSTSKTSMNSPSLAETTAS